MHFSPSSNKDHFNLIIKKTLNGITIKSEDEILEGLKSLPKDISFDVPDGEYNTLLYLAAANNFNRVVAHLLTERKVNPNVKVSDGLTASHIATTLGHLDILKMLAAHQDIKLSEKDLFGETPLFRAVGNLTEKKALDAATIILNKDKTSLSIGNEDNIIPIEIAMGRGFSAVVEFLLKQGTEVTEELSAKAALLLKSLSTNKNSFGTPQNFYTPTSPNNPIYRSAHLIVSAYIEHNKARSSLSTVYS